jgi:threonine-phosphate decarboxylase
MSKTAGKHSKYSWLGECDWDGPQQKMMMVSRGTSACAHGGIYSVNHGRVKLDFSSSINPLGIAPRALEAITERASELASAYPDPDSTELRNSLAHHLRIDPECIVAGNGAVEIIYWFAQAFAGKHAAVPAPTFCEYELASQRAGAKVKFIALHEFSLDADSFIRRSKGADSIYLCNPNNPTGLLATKDIERIVTNADRKTMILLDECFIELVDQPERNSFITRLAEFGNLVLLRSLTKSYGLAGLRVGYACCGSPSVVEKLKRYRIPWNVNGIAQAAGVAALSDSRYVRRARTVIVNERRFLFQKLSRMNPFTPHRSDVNYFMLNLGRHDSAKFRDDLLKKTGILVRDCSTFTGMDSHHVRIAVRNRTENRLLLAALEAFEDGV